MSSCQTANLHQGRLASLYSVSPEVLPVEPIPKEKVKWNRPNIVILQNPRNIRSFWQGARNGVLKGRLTFNIDPKEDLDQDGDDFEDDDFEDKR